MRLTKEQNRLALLEYERQAAQIGASAKRQLEDVKRTKLQEGWPLNDPKFFASCAFVYVQRTPDYLWARAMSLLEVAEHAGLLGDNECFEDLLKEVRSTARKLGDKGRESSLGDPFGDFSKIIQKTLSEALPQIEKEIERRHLVAQSNVPRPQVEEKHSPTWVLTLHGIRTRGVWQKNIVPALNSAGFSTVPLDYGSFWALQLLVPRLRAHKVEWFKQEYTRHVMEKGAVPSIVAHSFGTYIVARALVRYPEICFERIIFAGSIVPRDFPWADHIPSQVTAVLNDCGDQDIWSAVAPWMIRDAGRSGKSGFLDTAEGKVINRTRPSFGHSDHFYNLNYIKSWVPFLQCGDVAKIPASSHSTRNVRFRVARVLVIVIILASLLGIPALRHQAVRFAKAATRVLHLGYLHGEPRTVARS